MTLKTQPGPEGANELVSAIEDPNRRQDCKTLLDFFKSITNQDPVVWGGAMIGYGRYAYKTQNGQEAEWFKVGFANRKTSLTIYVISGYKREPQLMKSLGKYKTGKSCLYIKQLNDIDLDVLKEVVENSYRWMSENY
ncbi:MAG: DUF1801 domain-containing protein [Reichenbachiella sp.]|uniref:DUF1801 domain-containing protein n=1 Tax=Reichenbachiella sp. TaxID=2184521 RepID=UPI0032661DAC